MTIAEQGSNVRLMAAASHWIAIVDDDASVLKALERSLRVRAFRTTTHNSAIDFLASLSEELPECLIIDQQMPDMTGLELHQHLKGRGIQIPTIMITAHSDARLRERSEAAGVAALLSKPLHNASLFAAIDAALATIAAQHEPHRHPRRAARERAGPLFAQLYWLKPIARRPDAGCPRTET